MSLEAAILGFLGEEDRSGYDLKTRCFDGAARDFWTADQAQIYRTLERLQAAKLVRCSRKRQVGKPDRKLFALTAAGTALLEEWLGANQSLPAPRDAFLMQLYFSGTQPDSRILELFGARRALHQARLDELRARAATSVRDSAVSQRATVVRGAAFDGAIAVERTLIDWLDDCVESVHAGALPRQEAAEAAREGLFGTSTA
jgi:DNA-binding PadR family transcriptional regulator